MWFYIQGDQMPNIIPAKISLWWRFNSWIYYWYFESKKFNIKKWYRKYKKEQQLKRIDAQYLEYCKRNSESLIEMNGKFDREYKELLNGISRNN